MTSQIRSACSFVTCIVFLVLTFFSICQATEKSSAATAAYRISEVKMEQTADDFLLKILGNAPPTYTMYELFDPLRIIIDVADAALSTSAVMPMDLPMGPVQQVKSKVLADQEPPITRIEILLSGDHGYTVERQEKNIVIAFAKESAEEQKAPATSMAVQAAADFADSQAGPATMLTGIDVDALTPAVTRVFIKTDGSVAHYTKAQLKKGANRPDRMYIDIPDVKLLGKNMDKEVGTSLARIRAAQRQDTVRIVFDSGRDTLFQYEIEEQPNGLVVTIQEPSQAEAIIAGIMQQDETGGQAEGIPDSKPETTSGSSISPPADELIKPVIPVAPVAKAKDDTAAAEKTPPKAEAPAVQEKKESSPQDTFAFAGYQKQKITVDFFKIDLHNVFRLFGEISGLNIVVDEEVKGSLTLALNEVPWDFALDIILNLKDLQKEERYNTIVISPKAKELLWPKTATEQIAFKADGAKVEAISVKQRLDAPKEVVEAKKLIHEAQELDKKAAYAEALDLYEKAFAQWKDNSQLASRIASLCLVRLGLNAKAVHYAKAAIQADPQNYNAGLQAAISLANMKQVEEAKKYFDLAISGEKPASEALISYAAFAEEYQSYAGALSLLKKHQDLYGDSLDTLIAKARIHDKRGNNDKAVEAYRSVLLSGYNIPADLRQYIQGRIAAASSM